MAARRVSDGILSLGLGEAAKHAIQFFLTIVLARLLTPSDFGLAAMAMLTVGMIDAVSRCALPEALVQRAQVNDDDWSSCYWLTIAWAIAAAGLVWVTAPIAAGFYGDERLVGLVRLAGVGLVVRASGTTPSAWLVRRLRFRTIAVIEAVGFIAAMPVAVWMAWRGWGAWAVVTMIVVAFALAAVLFQIACPWKPALTLKLATVRPLVRFALGFQAFGLLNFLSRRVDEILIGRGGGSSALGLYARAYQLSLYPSHMLLIVFGRAMFPALSQAGDDLPRFRTTYLRAVTVISTVAFPALVGVALIAPELVNVLYGPQWVPAVAVVQILCFVAAVQAVTYTVTWIYLATARTWAMTWSSLAVGVCVGAAIVTGGRWGLPGAAAGYLGATVLVAAPYLMFPLRLIGLSLRDVVTAARKAFVGSLVMAAVVVPVRAVALSQDWGNPVTLGCAVLAGAGTFLVWLAIAERPLLLVAWNVAREIPRRRAMSDERPVGRPDTARPLTSGVEHV